MQLIIYVFLLFLFRFWELPNHERRGKNKFQVFYISERAWELRWDEIGRGNYSAAEEKRAHQGFDPCVGEYRGFM